MSGRRRGDAPPSIGELHDRALAESDPGAQEGARRWLAWLDAQAPGPASSERAPAAAVAVPDDWAARPPRTIRNVAVGVGCAAAAFAAWVSAHPRPPAPVGPLPGPSPRAEPAPRPASSVAADPCASAVKASGEWPQIDDFEDDNELVDLRESRNGYWVAITDRDPAHAEPVLLPSLRPDARAGNRYALHLAGPRHTGWGASVQLEFGPTCYDASVYRGIAFDARGPGRVYAGVREVDAVPTERGGTCRHDCYRSHLSPIDLKDGWSHHELTWSELHQERGTTSARPNRLSGLEFLVRSEDTPYDLWIDDVRFVR